MADPKPFASLSSSLLARKGAARPAMRPQGFGQLGNGLDDLGWNDMGHESPKPTDAPYDAFGEDGDDQPRIHHPTGLTPVQSPVHDQQAELADRLGIDPDDEEYDETAELYDPNAVDETEEDEAEEAEADELYQAPLAEPEPVLAQPVVKKQPIQFPSQFDETLATAPDEEPLDLCERFDETPGTAADEQAFEQIEEPNAASDATAADEPFELTQRFEDFDPFDQAEDESASAEFAPPAAPPSPVFQPVSGYEPVAPYTPAGADQPTPRAAPGGKAKAAFTLRLDPERHLKLRLACAVNGRSAQQIVTAAVDRLLREMPELDAMAEKAKRRG